MTMLVRGGAAAGSTLPTTATTGQILQWNGSAWVPATPSASGTTPNATTAVPGLVQLAGDLAGTATAPTVTKINGTAPAPVATTGAYNDLTGRPVLAPVATSGAYTDLTGRPALAGVATSGAYTDLTGRPALAGVATSGSYGDLTNRPLLATVATSGAYADLTGAPAVPTVYLRGKTAATPITSATATSDPDLQVVGLPVGTYALEAFLAAASSNAAATTYSFGGSATVTGSYVANAGTATQVTSLAGTSTYATAGRVAVTGTVVCTAAGLFAVQLSSASAPSQVGTAPGSWLRLTKVA